MANKKDSLGDRMKENYENRTRILLPRRTNVLIRIDGKAFHTYTKGLDRPIDQGLIEDMNETTKYLCENIQGAKFGYVQSDEISILITDYDDITTDAWFDYNLQKMCSISASLTTAKFNQLRLARVKNGTFANETYDHPRLATFDARVFVIPDIEEVINYFVWRQQDATRNSISMAAQSMFSHKQLQGKSTSDMQDMMMLEKQVNWDSYPAGFKRGRCVKKTLEVSDILLKITKTEKLKNELTIKGKYEEASKLKKQREALEKQLVENPESIKVKKSWEILDPPIFSKDRDFILNKILKDAQ